MWKSVTRLAGSIVEDGPVVHGDDVCHCRCHQMPTVMHVKPCCRPCPNCRRNIADGKFAEHLQRCVLSAGRNP
ncbi:MAG: hypothetical protein V4671_10090 [Armatimonadota bacterium]